MGQFTRLRCPACGVAGGGQRFGITVDGFDPAARPEHAIERIVFESNGGRGHGIKVADRGPVTLDEAVALRASLHAALAQLDSEIAEATGGADEDDDYDASDSDDEGVDPDADDASSW